MLDYIGQFGSFQRKIFLLLRWVRCNLHLLTIEMSEKWMVNAPAVGFCLSSMRHFPFLLFKIFPPLNSAWYQLQEGLQWSSLLSLVSQTRCCFWCYLWARLQFIHRMMIHHLVQTSLQTISGFTPNYRCKVSHCESGDVSSLTYYQHEASDNMN